MPSYKKDLQYAKFSAYGFLRNLRFFDAFILIYLNSMGVSYTHIGTLYAIRQLVSFFMEIPSGIIADRSGRKTVLVCSFAVYILSFLILYRFNQLFFIYIAFILYGTADAFRSGTHKSIIMDYLRLNDWQKDNIDYYGHTRSWSQRGSALSSLIAAVLVFYSDDFRNIFLFSVIPYLLDMLLVLSYPNVLNHPHPNSNATHKTSEKVPLGTYIKHLKITISNIEVFGIINTSALHSAYLSAIKDYIQPIMATLALAISWPVLLEKNQKTGIVVGICYFVIYILTSITSAQADNVTRKYHGRWPIQKITLLCGLLSGAIAGIFYEVHWLLLSLLFFTSVYLIENLRKPILIGYIADKVPDELLTSVLSVQSFINTVMAAAISIALGLFSDHFGIGSALAWISVALIVITLLVQREKNAGRQ